MVPPVLATTAGPEASRRPDLAPTNSLRLPVEGGAHDLLLALPNVPGGPHRGNDPVSGLPRHASRAAGLHSLVRGLLLAQHTLDAGEAVRSPPSTSFGESRRALVSEKVASSASACTSQVMPGASAPKRQSSTAHDRRSGGVRAWGRARENWRPATSCDFCQDVRAASRRSTCNRLPGNRNSPRRISFCVCRVPYAPRDLTEPLCLLLQSIGQALRTPPARHAGDP